MRVFFASAANIHAKTKGEMQTPIHYAAKNDAGQALKMLLKLEANMEDRDYKNRTPLQVAAELGRINVFLLTTMSLISWKNYNLVFVDIYCRSF